VRSTQTARGAAAALIVIALIAAPGAVCASATPRPASAATVSATTSGSDGTTAASTDDASPVDASSPTEATEATEATTHRDVDRRIKDPAIVESSGLAASLLHEDVLWTHNDSGNPNQIYAVAADGTTAATVTIAGEPAQDWEAITSFRAPRNAPAAGRALIAVADIGDNDADRNSIRIAIIAEPKTLADATIKPIRVLRLTYPGGPRDAEAVLADPRNGRLYVVSKSLLGGEVFAVPTRIWPGDQARGTSAVTPLTSLASTGAMLVTDGGFRPDGTMVLRGYGNLKVIAAPETAQDGRLETLASQSLPKQRQGESLVVVDDGREALIGSEGPTSAILRVRLPSVTTAEVTSTATASASAAIITETSARLSDLVGNDRRLEWVLGSGGVAVAAVALFCLALLLRSGRSNRSHR